MSPVRLGAPEQLDRGVKREVLGTSKSKGDVILFGSMVAVRSLLTTDISIPLDVEGKVGGNYTAKYTMEHENDPTFAEDLIDDQDETMASLAIILARCKSAVPEMVIADVDMQEQVLTKLNDL
jgi:hypothetical protein